MADSARSRFRPPVWGWLLLSGVVLVLGLVGAIPYPEGESGWPTVDATVVFMLVASGIWLLIRFVDGGKRGVAIPCACVVLVIGVGMVSIWLPYAMDRQVIHDIEGWGGSVECNQGRWDSWGRLTTSTVPWRFKFFEPVVYVNLAETRATDVQIAQLSRFKNLRQLNLSQTAVTDAGLAHLSGLQDLSELYLGTASVTDSGLAHLSGLTNLRWLSLYGTQITDAGLIHLIGMTDLDALWLNNTKLTDSSLPHLGKLKNLRELWLIRTRVTDKGVGELRKALPQCTIHWF